MCFFAVSTTTCSDLTAPTNGMIAYNMESMDTRPLNTVATYTCITGYTVTGDMTKSCGAGGMWSGTDPTCECESIQIVKATLYATKQLKLTASYNYFYSVICRNVQLTANGVVTYSDLTIPRAVDSTVTYSCVLGYEFSGGVPRTCTVSGWTDGGSPTCTG